MISYIVYTKNIEYSVMMMLKQIYKDITSIDNLYSPNQ